MLYAACMKRPSSGVDCGHIKFLVLEMLPKELCPDPWGWTNMGVMERDFLGERGRKLSCSGARGRVRVKGEGVSVDK